MNKHKTTKTDIFGVGFALCSFVFIWWLFLSVVASTYRDNNKMCKSGKDLPLIKTDMFCSNKDEAET